MTSSRAFFSLLLLVGLAARGEVLEGEVAREGSHYRVHFEILIHAPMERVLPLIRDYAHLPRISPCIRSVKILTPPGEDPIVMEVKSRFCVLFVCKKLRYLQRVEEHPPGHIHTEVLPGTGDLHRGHVNYRFQPHPEGTELTLEGDIVPAFWVPPWIGPLLIRHALAKEAGAIAQRLEDLARVP